MGRERKDFNEFWRDRGNDTDVLTLIIYFVFPEGVVYIIEGKLISTNFDNEMIKFTCTA